MNEKLIELPMQIESMIFNFRGVPVLIDFHLANLYQVETKRLNEQVKRNNSRFPNEFMFQLNQLEWENLKLQILNSKTTSVLRSQFATTKRRALPYVFTEQGVAMLSAVLNSETAIQVSLEIMNVFVKMRKIMIDNALLYQRLNRVEQKQIESDLKFEQVFKALESTDIIPKQGVFFNGQVFDAYELTSKIIRNAKNNIVLIDNYIDETTLIHLTKKNKEVKVLLLSKSINKTLELDIIKANEQYGDFVIKHFNLSHDRFIIIDNKEIYHLGASLKDLGKKWFAFSKMDKSSVSNILNSIKELIQ